MNNKIFLVLGGARSGKSEFAEKLMYHSTGKRKGYIATSQILDDEMRYRVILHRERRPADWQTFEVMGQGRKWVISLRKRMPSFLIVLPCM